MKKTINSLSAFFAILSFLAMLGTVGGLENNTMTITQTFLTFAISLFSGFISYSIYMLTKEN